MPNRSAARTEASPTSLIGSLLLALAVIGAIATGARKEWRGRQVRGGAPAPGAERVAGAGTAPVAAEGAEHGRHADTPSEIGVSGWKEILRRVYGEFNSDRLSLVAAGVAFFGLLALFPAIAALVALYGIFADPSSINAQLAALEGVVPEEGLGIIRRQVERLTAQGQGSLGLVFLAGLAISLWSAMSGVKTVFDALNIVYDEREKRGLLMLNFQALLFTLATLLFVVIAMGAIVVVPVVVSWIGIGGSLLPALRWPLMYLLLLVALALLYRYGPSRERARWRWVTWGSAIAGLLWIVGSILFSWYVANFGSYNETYGSLGAVIAFMVWLWLSAMVVLLGAEIDAEMEHQTARDTTEGTPRPRGERGAVAADSVA